jgi:rhodanese-related sulfurtransferase
MKRLLIFSLLVLFGLNGCQPDKVTGAGSGSPVSVDGGSYRNVTAGELNAMLANKDFVLINVHIPFDGNIAGTDKSIPYDEIDQDLSLLPADKNTKIVLYCRSGHMSAIAAQVLVKLGYSNIWNLDGGMQAWQQAGYEIQSK